MAHGLEIFNSVGELIFGNIHHLSRIIDKELVAQNVSSSRTISIPNANVEVCAFHHGTTENSRAHEVTLNKSTGLLTWTSTHDANYNCGPTQIVVFAYG